MSLDPELLKQLMETFKSELVEQTQIITNGLLELEKTQSVEEHTKTIEAIFRSAHNIKGTSRSLGITHVDQISHAIETLFSTFKNNSSIVPANIIDLCLEAVDKINSAMQSFLLNEPLSFDLSDLLNRLKNNEADKTSVVNSVKQTKKTQVSTTKDADVLKNETIRVGIDQIDRISALMEEMQVNKIAIDDHYNDLSKLHNKSVQFDQTWRKLSIAIKNSENISDDDLPGIFNSSSDQIYEMQNQMDQMYKNMRGRINELSTLSNAMQEEIRMLRLVPAANLFSTLPRYVRDMSHAMNKEIELTISGDDIKMDKVVLDGIKDPIIHILRNAVDHGIEDEKTRKTKGKPAVGHININIEEKENQVLIYIKDDGAGIDKKKIEDVILSKNLLTNSEFEKMGDDEIFDFIFHPGFSTKEIITDISGRGVGLNVVKTNLESLKGDVKITTEINQGTTFCLSVPFTVTSERGLMVKCGGEILVLPSTNVAKVFTIKPDDINEVQGTNVVMLDQHPVMLHTLASILSLSKTEMSIKSNLSVIIIKKDWHLVGFLVDEVIGEREIIIKPLQYPFTKIPCVAGGTLSGSSRIIVVLDPGDLIEKSLNIGKSAPISFTTEKIEAPGRPHILVVDDSITTRTLEKHVLESKNYQVTVAVDGQEAWDLLQKQKFSLLITDVTMPIMDGFTLTEHVKKSANTNYLPVIIVTSLGSDAEKKRGIEVGADAYIVKSEFESGALLEIVSQLV